MQAVVIVPQDIVTAPPNNYTTFSFCKVPILCPPLPNSRLIVITLYLHRNFKYGVLECSGSDSIFFLSLLIKDFRIQPGRSIQSSVTANKRINTCHQFIHAKTVFTLSDNVTLRNTGTSVATGRILTISAVILKVFRFFHNRFTSFPFSQIVLQQS